MERRDPQPYVDAINMLKRAFGRQDEPAWYMQDACFEDFNEGDDTGCLAGAFDGWGWRLEFAHHEGKLARSDIKAVCDLDRHGREYLKIIQSITGPVDIRRFFGLVLAEPGREGFIDPERLKALIPSIVRQARENLEAASREMRENPGAVCARGLLSALWDIFPEGKSAYVSDSSLLMEGTVADFAQGGLFPDICASFDPDLGMACEVKAEGHGRLHSYHALIRITDRDGRRISCGWGSLTEELAEDPLGMVDEVIGCMRDPAMYRADCLA